MWRGIEEWLLSYLPQGKSMRKRKDIAKDAIRKEDLIIEVLLDIRDLLVKQNKVVRADRKRSTKTSV